MSTLKVDTIDTSNSSGNITVSRPLSGSGASLTALNATELTSGTIPIARIADDAVTNAKMADDAIDSAQIADGAVDNVHLATGVDAAKLTTGALPMARLSGTLPALNGSALTALNATQLTSGTIPIARIADDAITLAKMAPGTDGNIISYDASGNPVAIATGTDGQVLTSTGAGSPPAFEDTAGGNTPQFYVYDENVTQSITSATWTKVNFPDTLFDADNVFDNSSNHRFTVPSGQAGKYVLATRVSVYSGSNNITDARVKIYKNGSFYHGGYLFAYGSNIRHIAPHLNFIEDAAVGDYYEVYIFVNATNPNIFADSENKKFQYFYGYKIG